MEGWQNPYAPPRDAADFPMDPGDRPDGRLASPGRRWLGAFLDGVILWAAMIPGVVAVALVREADVRPPVMVAVMGLGFALIVTVQAILVTTSGQSLGKKIVGTRIVRQDGTLPGFLYGVVLRSWLVAMIGFVPCLGGVFSLIDALCVFRLDRRCLHDHISGTIVIKV
jgi:uncharacterized RDD family membrane protein YckC